MNPITEMHINFLRKELERKDLALRDICNLGAGATPPDVWGYVRWHDEIMKMAIRGARKAE